VASARRPLRALLVEDDADDAALVERQLNSAGFEVTSRRVASAAQTRDALQTQTWDVVLADFSLPGFRGVDVLPMLAEYGLASPFIIVSGTIDVTTALEAMKAGARDYVLKGELKRLPAVVERELESAAVQEKRRRAELERDQALVELQGANQELRCLAEENAQRYEAEHRVAEILQEALLALPESVPGVRFAARYVSGADNARVGGDFYDLFEIADGCIGILIGDVSGKGLEAATLTSVVRNSVRLRAMDGLSPAETMAKTNQTFHALTSVETFVTVFFGVLDVSAGRLTYVSAGHPPAMIRRGSGRVDVLGISSPIVGAFPDIGFSDLQADLGSADVLLLYTDGLIEARGEDRSLYGQERLCALLGRLGDGTSPEDVAEEVFADVLEYAGGRMRDDLALLAIGRIA
jgi:serine phosphatase RsbU (regulator of sigma subunit)